MKNFCPIAPTRFSFLKKLFVFSISITCSISAYAMESGADASLSEEDFLADIPVVLTATRLAQPITEAPAAITIIDREMIRASGAREIVDLFRIVPGFVVSHDSGHQPIVSYHGLTDEYAVRLQVLIDGRSVNTPLFGGVVWANLPLAMDNIERIEVIRGPNSASYGTGSFLSVINIVTQHASETTGTFVHAIQGTNGAKDVYARFGDTTGDFDYRVTAGINNDNGFEAREDDRRMKTARFRGDYQFDANDSLMFQTGITRGAREIDSKSLKTFKDRDVRINFEQIRWGRQINNNDALSLQFFHTVEDITEIFDVILPPAVHVVRDNSTRSERFDLELQHTKQLTEAARVVWGLGLRQDGAKGLQIFGTDPATGYTGNKTYFYNRLARAFGNVEWRIKNNLALNLGTMWEKSELADQELSPRASLNFSITPEQSIRFIASRATRTPSLIEALGNNRIPIENWPAPPTNFTTVQWVGNENLKPAKITSYELGYHASLVREKLSFDLKLFRENLRDLITLDENSVPNPSDPLNGEYEIYANATDGDIHGAEANLEFFPLRDTRVVMSRSYTKIKSENPNVPSQDLAKSAPKFITSLLLINRFPGGITGSVMYYRVSDSNGLGSGKPMEGYEHTNLRLAFPLKWSKVTGELALVIQNAMGDYVDWRRDNIAETQRYISVSGQWN